MRRRKPNKPPPQLNAAYYRAIDRVINRAKIPGPSASVVMGLVFMFLVGLLFLATGASDVYRTASRWHEIRQQGEKYQVATSTFVHADTPWFALSVSRPGGGKWYRVQYGFVTSEGRTMQGEDWIHLMNYSFRDSIPIAYQPADVTSNRIYTSDNPYDLQEDWGRGVIGGLFVLVGAFFMVLPCWMLKQ